MKQENVFDYLESIEEDALIVVSNHDNDEGGDDHGLIAGHAYSVEDFESKIFMSFLFGFFFVVFIVSINFSSEQWPKDLTAS